MWNLHQKSQKSGNDPRFVPCESVYVRFPGVRGLALQTKVFGSYLISVDGDWQLKFFADGQMKCLERHPLNNRDHQAVRQKYVSKVLADGLLDGVRGQAWAVPASGGKNDRFALLSHATLTESIYAVAPQRPRQTPT